MHMQTAFKYPDTPLCSIAFPTLIPAELIRRDNRFRLSVRLPNGEQHAAHLANPGRLQELMIPGRQLWLSKADNPKRKTGYDTQLIEHDQLLISLNSLIPNQLINQALQTGLFSELPAFRSVRSEVQWHDSRFDFLIANDKERCWVEVKSVTLIENGYAAFPDAPTNRGRKHLIELAETIRQGDQAAVIFVIQRADAQGFRPHDSTDPEFGDALREAHKAGVQVIAVKCEVTTQRISITHRIPVCLDAAPA